MIYKIFIIFLFLFFSNNIFSKNLFETDHKLINFQDSNINNIKDEEIKKIKLKNLNIILKNVLSENDYNKVKREINEDFANSLIKNIIIEDENIINNNYSANIKVNFNKKFIINYLRKKELSYVEFHPKNFLIIVFEKNDINKNLFFKKNEFYYFLNNKENKYNNFYNIPNFDINDKYILSVEDIEQRNFKNIKLVKNKYNSKNIILIEQKKEFNTSFVDIFYVNENEFINLKSYKLESINYDNFFLNLKLLILDYWKSQNSIQNVKLNLINCEIHSLNIYELKEIKKIIDDISIINKIELLSMTLNKNLYKINFYGNLDIFKILLSMNNVILKENVNNCIIKLK